MPASFAGAVFLLWHWRCWPEGSNAAERVMLTINDAKSFLGLAGSSGEIYQYVANGKEDNHEKFRFSIGGSTQT
jgi:hypothetical protein